MAKLDCAIDTIIRNALEKGVFANLPGKGKPLKMRQNPLVAKEWRKAQAQFCGTPTALNKRIQRYKAQIPADVFLPATHPGAAGSGPNLSGLTRKLAA